MRTNITNQRYPTPRKLPNVWRLTKLGLQAKTLLRESIALAHYDFQKNTFS
jgi:hypothetical protein